MQQMRNRRVVAVGQSAIVKTAIAPVMPASAPVKIVAARVVKIARAVALQNVLANVAAAQPTRPPQVAVVRARTVVPKPQPQQRLLQV